MAGERRAGGFAGHRRLGLTVGVVISYMVFIDVRGC